MRPSSPALVVLASLSIALGCATTPEPAPSEPSSSSMGAAEHLQEAERHEREASDLTSGESRPHEPTRMSSGLDSVSTSGGQPLVRPRWTASVSPSARHRREAERMRALAAEHRRQARALVQAEERACQGLTEDEMALGPFFHSDDIESVEPLKKNDQVIGATIRFREVEGLTSAWVERAVDCARARAAALGHPMKQMASPLVLRDIQTQVVDSGAFVVVTIEATDPAIAFEVFDRARARLHATTE